MTSKDLSNDVKGPFDLAIELPAKPFDLSVGPKGRPSELPSREIRPLKVS